jgi:hypothetical protein
VILTCVNLLLTTKIAVLPTLKRSSIIAKIDLKEVASSNVTKKNNSAIVTPQPCLKPVQNFTTKGVRIC